MLNIQILKPCDCCFESQCVMNENTEHDATKLETKAKEEKEHRRTKRAISKPWYLEDYATK